jgi:hypothetical protein
VRGRDFFCFLSESMVLLERESSENYAHLASELEGLRALIDTKLDKHVVYFDGFRFIVASGELSRDVEIGFAEEAILKLLDGHHSLPEAVIRDEILLRGGLAVLDKFQRGLNIYLNGALRCPSFPALLSDYRQTVFGA